MLPPKPTNQHAGVNKPKTGHPPLDSGAIDADSLRLVRLDGLCVRRRRHEHGWSTRELTSAIEKASLHSSGLRRTLTPSLIKAVEEQAEPIPYQQLWLLADGLGCDPVDLVSDDEFSIEDPGTPPGFERKRGFE